MTAVGRLGGTQRGRGGGREEGRKGEEREGGKEPRTSSWQAQTGQQKILHMYTICCMFLEVAKEKFTDLQRATANEFRKEFVSPMEARRTAVCLISSISAYIYIRRPLVGPQTAEEYWRSHVTVQVYCYRSAVKCDLQVWITVF